MRAQAGTAALVSAAVLALLAGCGGGGGGGGSGGTPAAQVVPGTADDGVAPIAVAPGEIVASASLAGRCAAPRVGTNPATGDAFGDQQGTLTDEKNWVRAWIDETYLWYDEVPTNLAAANYATPVAYFNVLKTPQLTASGRAKDRFHFVYDTAVYANINASVESGYGLQFAFVARSAPRNIRVAFTEPGSPAAAAGIARGAKVLSVDGVDAVNATSTADVATLNAGLAPSANGQAHRFTLQAVDGSTSTVTLTSANISRTPVQNVRTLDTASGRVGYLLFNDHVDKSEAQLIAAVNQFKTAGIADLVLDLRYNGGGKLAIASQLAYMVASPAATAGTTFERIASNAKNPFNFSAAQAALPFYSRTRGYSTTSGQPMPQLGLSRVTVLAGPDTCSASESIVNGLRGVGVAVNLIGGTTCGKPYGFYPQDNCGTTYFAIQTKGVNAQGFGDYGDGFAPTCTVADDFQRPLGDAAEARLAAALTYRSTGACPVPAAALAARSALGAATAVAESPETPYLDSPVLRTNRLLE